MSQFSREAKTKRFFSHSCKQICSVDTWIYEHLYAKSGWDLVTEGEQENRAENNSYMLPKYKTKTLTYIKKTPESMEIYKTCQRNKNDLPMKLSL